MTDPDSLHASNAPWPDYWRPPNSGPDCSTPRSTRLRERRFEMAYEQRTEPPASTRLAEEARALFLEHEPSDPAMARALALRHVIVNFEPTPEPDALFVGGEDPFFFNLMLPALQADRHSREGHRAPDALSESMRGASLFYAACFEGHITPGIEYILGQGVVGFRRRIEEQIASTLAAGAVEADVEAFYRAAVASCDNLLLYASRYRQACLRVAEASADPGFARMAAEAAATLARVPEHPASTFREALQSYWVAYILVTLEMGGCCPGGGIGLGRLDQFLYPYYQRDLAAGRLDRAEALELMELFLLNFRHIDYYTPHQICTPGSQASLGGITPAGADACNDLTELILEASLRIAMPAPYLSLRLYEEAPDRWWRMAANYILGGLGFPVVNDEVLIPAMLKHGRSLNDARDYICSCCYENTIPGREAFHPNGAYLNLPLVLEMALHRGRTLVGDRLIGADTPDLAHAISFAEVLAAFEAQLDHAISHLAGVVNSTDRSHTASRRYPMMSLFIEDCIAKGLDVCAGGAQYNLVGCIVAGLPNVVNSLAAIRQVVFGERSVAMADLLPALAGDFEGADHLRLRLLRAPKWGNDDPRVDDLATWVTDRLYQRIQGLRNARGGRWQMALYSFIANHSLGQAVGASADGRRAATSLTRNLDPTWGTDKVGPTGVLRSLGAIDFTNAPDGASLNLRFDPAICNTEAGREAFVGFLKAFVGLGVMEMQVTMADTDTLKDARVHPERHTNLMVRVAGYSARFIDLPANEQDEIIGRSEQRV